MLGKLTKMTLVGFKDPEFRRPTFNVYQALVNPESYALNYAVVYNQEQAPGASANSGSYVNTPPRRLEFEFLFDATGALEAGGLSPARLSGLGVWAQLEEFKRAVYYYEGSAHRPPYVRLQWGQLVFKCQLETLSVTCKLFRPDGTPIRAVAKAAFVETVPDHHRTALENALSADLTHVRTVQAGDTLPLLCYQIYDDATLYREVARVNQLLDFRRLRVGQQLFFPPLVAEEAAD